MTKKMMSRLLGASTLVAATFAPQAFAGGGGGVDYSDLLDAIDFSTIATGLIGAGAALVAVYLAIKGVKLIVGFVRGG